MDVQSLVNLDYKNDWRKFASLLFSLEDADPGYVMLRRAKMSYYQKLRYVLAWCTYYNPGIAAVASQYQTEDFYEYLRSVYDTAKRASERRHFRGKAGLKALAQWEEMFPIPEEMVEACHAQTYLGVRKNMKNMAQMGDYFYWKLADIFDTVFNNRVDFTGCERYMPKVPKEGAGIIALMETPVGLFEPDLAETMAVITRYIRRNVEYTLKTRPLDLQEAETVCCVFKQHVSGKYFFGSRSAKAFKRLADVKNEAPDTVKALTDGLLAGGIWTKSDLNELCQHL